MLVISMDLLIPCDAISYVVKYCSQKRLLCQKGTHVKYSLCCVLLNGMSLKNQFKCHLYHKDFSDTLYHAHMFSHVLSLPSLNIHCNLFLHLFRLSFLLIYCKV